MTKYPSIFAALSAPFPPDVVKSRSGGGGRTLSYITARVAMNRLDEVVGPENWRNRHRLEQMADGTAHVVCTIAVRVDGEWVEKEDAGGFKEMTEKNRQGETVEDEENTAKTAYSDAFKRTAILWGVGRYLYKDGVAHYGDQPDPPPQRQPQRQAPPPQSQHGEWGGPHPQRQQSNGNGNGEAKKYDGPPKTGRAMFAWIMEEKKAGWESLLNDVNNWAKQVGIKGMIKDWSTDDVNRALYEIEGWRNGENQEPAGHPVTQYAEVTGEDIPF